MAIRNQNFSFHRGEKVRLDLTVEDAAGAPVNITGWPIIFVMQARQNGSDYEVLRTVGDGVTLTSPLVGQCQITLPKAITTLLDFNSHPWSAQSSDDDDGAVLADGKATVKSPRVVTPA